MVLDPDFVRYACIAHRHKMSLETTILAEFNSADSFLQDMAKKCLHCSPNHHSVFSHTHQNQSFTFLICDPFIYFGIFAKNMLKSDQIQFLGRLKEVLNRLIKGDRNYKFSSYCLQGEIHPIFHKLLSKSQDFDALHLITNGVDTLKSKSPSSISCSSKMRKIFTIQSISSSKTTKGHKKKLSGDGKNENRDTFVNGKFDLSGDINGVSEVKNKEIGCCHNNVSLIDGGNVMGRQKAKKIWRRHVWVVLILDLAICLILFGIWLFVCQGFQCIEA